VTCEVCPPSNINPSTMRPELASALCRCSITPQSRSPRQPQLLPVRCLDGRCSRGTWLLASAQEPLAPCENGVVTPTVCYAAQPKSPSRGCLATASRCSVWKRMRCFNFICKRYLSLILFVNGIYTAACVALVKFCVAATSFQVVHDENLPRNASIVLAISNPSVGCSV
jgi:hypothetical protein